VRACEMIPDNCPASPTPSRGEYGEILSASQLPYRGGEYAPNVYAQSYSSLSFNEKLRNFRDLRLWT
jgi:hypothetical protein